MKHSLLKKETVVKEKKTPMFSRSHLSPSFVFSRMWRVAKKRLSHALARVHAYIGNANDKARKSGARGLRWQMEWERSAGVRKNVADEDPATDPRAHLPSNISRKKSAARDERRGSSFAVEFMPPGVIKQSAREKTAGWCTTVRESPRCVKKGDRGAREKRSDRDRRRRRRRRPAMVAAQGSENVRDL